MEIKVNQIKTNNINLQGIKPNAKGVKSMDELIKKMIKDITKNAEGKIPEYSIYDFPPVKSSFENPDKNLCAKGFILKIYQPPKGVKNRETLRAMDLIAYKEGSDYVTQRMLACGSADEIIKKLNDQNLVSEIKEAVYSLSEKLKDI